MAIADQMMKKKWGVFNHYLYGIQNNPALPNNQGAGETDWNTCTAALDVEKIARTLHEVGAGYYFITTMQGRKYMIADNEYYRGLVGDDVADEALSRRDLIEDLYQALSKYGIDLYLYFTGDGPYKDEEIGSKFGFVEPREKNMNMGFVQNWSKTLEAYAVKYGDKVNGWWVDGCYEEWFGYTEELLHPYYEAVKKGNPEALVTFNNGTKPWLYRYYPREDFTSGEHENLNVVPESRFFEGVQSHILLPIGAGDSGIGCTWGSGGLGFTKEELADYVSRVTSVGGVVTLDCMLNRDGSFDPVQVEALKYIGEKVNK